MPFSVLMSLYEKEQPSYFRAAVDSVLAQQPSPDEIVLVLDGPLSTALQDAVQEYAQLLGERLTLIPLETNQGLGPALCIGVEKAKHSLIARMDTDDICLEGRFARQLAFMESYPEVGMVGGQIEEFITSPEELVSKREVPCEHEAICSFLKTRSPFNHMTVMFRKEAVLAAGNYQRLHFLEDYYLWVRMWQAGVRFANLPDTVVHARIGEGMFARRGGRRYYASWRVLERYKRENGLTTWGRSARTLLMRYVVSVLMPARVRGRILERFARKKIG